MDMSCCDDYLYVFKAIKLLLFVFYSSVLILLLEGILRLCSLSLKQSVALV